jgi:hypothetical protein
MEFGFVTGSVSSFRFFPSWSHSRSNASATNMETPASQADLDDQVPEITTEIRGSGWKGGWKMRSN